MIPDGTQKGTKWIHVEVWHANVHIWQLGQVRVQVKVESVASSWLTTSCLPLLGNGLSGGGISVFDI